MLKNYILIKLILNFVSNEFMLFDTFLFTKSAQIKNIRLCRNSFSSIYNNYTFSLEQSNKVESLFFKGLLRVCVCVGGGGGGGKYYEHSHKVQVSFRVDSKTSQVDSKTSQQFKYTKKYQQETKPDLQFHKLRFQTDCNKMTQG